MMDLPGRGLRPARGPSDPAMRILVVEDYQPLRAALAKGLREAGYAVDETGDGAEGLWYATGNPYDLIVLDLMLPGLDGLTVLDRLRAAGCASHVLVLTARDGVEDRVEGLDHGADDYLVKPFAFPELLARVRALVRRGYQAKSPVIHVGDLEIDLVARRVARRGHEVALTAREFAILEFLALRTGQVVTRTELWDHLYEFGSDGGSNVLDVYVGYLRRKLEGEGEAKLIHTRRGQGYVFAEQG